MMWVLSDVFVQLFIEIKHNYKFIMFWNFLHSWRKLLITLFCLAVLPFRKVANYSGNNGFPLNVAIIILLFL